MPFLKFTRDRRGYENTFLLHPLRRKGGGDRNAVLYWFRTPPHVRIGRAAFDEQAIRALEEQHPDVPFDWPRILAARPPAIEEEPPRGPRRREGDGERGPAGPRGAREGSDHDRGGRDRPRRATPPATPAEPGDPGPARVEPVLEETLLPESGASPSESAERQRSIAERILGPEDLQRLRGRHAEVLARVTWRVSDPARAEALRRQALAIDPDAWVTEDDIRAGLSAYDSVMAELDRQIGKRRRRRGGRRRRGAVPAGSGDATSRSATTSADAGDPADDEADGGEDEADGGEEGED